MTAAPLDNRDAQAVIDEFIHKSATEGQAIAMMAQEIVALRRIERAADIGIVFGYDFHRSQAAAELLRQRRADAEAAAS